MIEVIVFAEGQSEEQFVKRVVSPALRNLQVFVKPQLLATSLHGQGGAVSFDRLKFNARNTLRQKPESVLTTFLDLYGLDTSFPSFMEAARKPNVFSQVTCLESALHQAIVSHVGCRADRFIAHIQPYEFEGLLFSDVKALCNTEPEWGEYVEALDEVRKSVESPEHINNGFETKPSRRLEKLLEPKYKKTRHAPLAAEKVTLAVMEAQCAHFHEWMSKLRALAR